MNPRDINPSTNSSSEKIDKPYCPMNQYPVNTGLVSPANKITLNIGKRQVQEEAKVTVDQTETESEGEGGFRVTKHCFNSHKQTLAHLILYF